jgi:Polyketide cyclase / dehydrase and lipid transport
VGDESRTGHDVVVDQHGHTWDRGPSDPPRLADGPGTFVEVDIDAPLADVWDIVTDISFGARFSEEFVGARWVDGATGPALGARFVGTNRHPAMGEWEVSCFVDRFVEHAEFGWRTSDPDRPGARWCHLLRRVDGITRVRHTLALGPGPSRLDDVIARMPDKEHRIIRARLDEHRANMQRVVDGIAAVATGAAGRYGT